MNPKCQNCGSENIKHIPAGFSQKKNKSYNAFSVCQDCKKTQNPPRQAQQPQPQRGNEEVMNALRELYRITKVNADNIAEIRELLEMRNENLDPSKIDFGS
jgi:hypothetical protein